MSYTKIPHVGKETSYYAWLNHVHYENLQRQEKIALVEAFLEDAAKKDCISVLEWSKEYYDSKPLWHNKFMPYPHILRLISWKFNPKFSMSNLPAFYEQHL